MPKRPEQRRDPDMCVNRTAQVIVSMKTRQSNSPSEQCRRILLVDSHPVMRRAVACWVNDTPDLKVCDEATNVVQALRAVARCKPDLVLTELADGGPAFGLVETLRRSQPDLPVLILSVYDETLCARRALDAGARGYLIKRAGGPNILDGIRRALRGEIVLSSLAARRLARIAPALKRPRTKTGPGDSK